MLTRCRLRKTGGMHSFGSPVRGWDPWQLPAAPAAHSESAVTDGDTTVAGEDGALLPPQPDGHQAPADGGGGAATLSLQCLFRCACDAPFHVPLCSANPTWLCCALFAEALFCSLSYCFEESGNASNVFQ